MNYQDLPWFIHKEIISLAVLEDPKFCLINKRTYECFGRLFKLLTYKSKPKSQSDKTSFSKKFLDVERIIFHRYKDIDWKQIYQCKNIRDISVCFDSENISPREKFVAGFSGLPPLQKLFFASSYFILNNDIYFSILKFHSKNLKELSIHTRNFSLQDQDEIFGNLAFHSLLFFSLKTSNTLEGLRYLQSNMPQLRSLETTCFSFEENKKEIIDYTWPSLKEFKFWPLPVAHNRYALRLALKKWSNITSFSINCHLFISKGVFHKVERLFIHNPNLHTFNTINLAFPNIKLVELHLSSMEHLEGISMLLNKIKTLKLYMTSERSSIKWPTSHFSLAEVEICSINHSFNKLFTWLSTSFDLKVLRIGNLITNKFPSLQNIVFKELECVFIESHNIHHVDAWTSFFSSRLHPKLKLVHFQKPSPDTYVPIQKITTPSRFAHLSEE